MDSRQKSPSREQVLNGITVCTEILGQPHRVADVLRILHQVNRDARHIKRHESRVG